MFSVCVYLLIGYGILKLCNIIADNVPDVHMLREEAQSKVGKSFSEWSIILLWLPMTLHFIYKKLKGSI